ncbi:DUF6193 family natural product biosynthesis protein [Kitasatospora sp. LaBMicrA B282]|uniref:DUF6193 family natural product biosynthesis protein n=1 Tax=Kitasatospora sp. LaBMicrA B282 TaxID=3420949 RepID=UPI003D0BF8F5
MTSSSANPVPDPVPHTRPETGSSLADTLCRTAAQLDLSLPMPEDKGERSAEFSNDDRRVVVLVLREERGYWVRCHGQGAWLATGVATELTTVVRAATAWMGGAGLEQTREVAPFIQYGDWAVAHEREPLDAVELAWCHTLDSLRLSPWDRSPRNLALLEAAYAQPELRRLTPVTSHFMLWFSTRARFPYVRVGYSIDPLPDGRCVVRDKGDVVAHTASPEEAVALVVAALPKDTGPAR